MNRHAIVSTRIGDLTLVASNNALAGVYFPHHWVKPAFSTLGERVSPTDPLLAQTARQLDEYLVGERTSFDLPTVLRGDEFQRRVWSILKKIPYGGTTSNGEIAERLGETAQAVGKAVGQNPLSIADPFGVPLGLGEVLGRLSQCAVLAAGPVPLDRVDRGVPQRKGPAQPPQPLLCLMHVLDGERREVSLRRQR